MRDGASYQTNLESSLDEAEKFVFSGSPFVRLAYDNGWIYLNVAEITTVIGAKSEEQNPEVINE